MAERTTAVVILEFDRKNDFLATGVFQRILGRIPDQAVSGAKSAARRQKTKECEP